jgi:asparagine synthase (glutamine-hydrolysing)
MTIYKGMRKLPSAHRFEFDLDTGRFSVEPYWELPVPLPADDGHDELHWTGRIRGTLAAAVNRRLESDVPLGAFLSGGIDSAAVTALIARRLGGRAVQTFSLGFSDPRFDESTQARQLAKAIGTDHHERIVSAGDVVDALPEVDAILDEPFADGSIIPTWMLCRFARREVTVALSGDGGDELFAGYQTFRALPAARLYNALVPKPLHRLVVMPLADRLPASNGYFSWDFKVRQFLRGMKVPPHQRLWRWLGAMAPEELSGLLMPEVLDQIEPRALFAQLRWMDGSMSDRDPIGRDTHMFTRTYLAEGVLAKVDRASMACSLEVRSPLLDVDLVELAATIPGRFKVKRGMPLKHVFRQAVRDLVPAEVLQRPKRGFALPIGAWFRGELRDMLLDTLSEKTIREQGLFRPEAVRRLLDEHLEGRRDHRKPLFALFMFERWRQHWLEGVETAPTRIAA